MCLMKIKERNLQTILQPFLLLARLFDSKNLKNFYLPSSYRHDLINDSIALIAIIHYYFLIHLNH